MAQQITDNLEVSGNLQVESNLVVKGTITTDTFNVKNLVTPNGSLASVGNWTYATENELNGKGLSWAWEQGSTYLSYMNGNRLRTNSSFDLSAGSFSFSIDNIPVLSSDRLGTGIVKSNLQQVGTLHSLQVSGAVNLSDLLFVDDVSNRIGIGTEEPGASLTILDNNVEIGIGSPDYGIGHIGTYSNSDFAIVTDGLSRINVKSTGEVSIGDPVKGGGKLNVYGTLTATNVITDYKIERSNPINFKASTGQDIYGLGLAWTGTGSARQFIMMGGPDRLWSTESIDLAPHQAYYLNGMVALSADGLGSTLLNSSLQTLGTLTSLKVAGHSDLSHVKAENLTLAVDTDSARYDQNSIDSNTNFNIKINGENLLALSNERVVLGDVQQQHTPVQIFGAVSINVNTPDPELSLAVNGNYMLGGKRFVHFPSAPATGEYQLGDICWNTAPTPNSYIGWICVASGTPGIWNGFGMIASQ
jgi:hypothetical protein